MSDIIDKLKKVRRGAMFIIEGPSGTGKGAICKEILAQDPHIKFSVSATTRPRRETEVEGVDYYFITDEQYDKLIEQDAFYEYVDSQYGARYGTLRSEVDSFLNVGEANAVAFKLPSGEVGLIDAGSEDTSLKVYNYLKSKFKDNKSIAGFSHTTSVLNEQSAGASFCRGAAPSAHPRGQKDRRDHAAHQ